jgi:hypothetical protein
VSSFFETTAFRVSLAALALTLGFRSAIFLPDSWQGNRQPGDAVDGYWRFATAEACYRDVPVIEFKGEKTIMHRHAKRTTLHDKTQFSASNGELLLKQPANEDNADLKIHFRDTGSRLIAYKIVDNGISYSKQEYATHSQQPLAVYDMIKCSDYSFTSRLKLIMNSPMEDFSTQL